MYLNIHLVAKVCLNIWFNFNIRCTLMLNNIVTIKEIPGQNHIYEKMIILKMLIVNWKSCIIILKQEKLQKFQQKLFLEFKIMKEVIELKCKDEECWNRERGRSGSNNQFGDSGRTRRNARIFATTSCNKKQTSSNESKRNNPEQLNNPNYVQVLAVYQLFNCSIFFYYLFLHFVVLIF